MDPRGAGWACAHGSRGRREAKCRRRGAQGTPRLRRPMLRQGGLPRGHRATQGVRQTLCSSPVMLR